MKHVDYPFIRAWARRIGSTNRFYVDAQVEEAKRDNAPYTAIYRRSEDGSWRTLDDVRYRQTREALVRYAARVLS